ncbi:MAG: AAA family ATPase [Dehalococcoidales bacterium]|nr:AAA family ATPase [Dehalococcoidales bacterium]
MLRSFDMLKGQDRKTKIISIANQKGGVGKTTTTINLGVALAERGKQVLLIDLDPQSNMTIGLGIDVDNIGNKNMYSALLDENVHLHKILQKTAIPGLLVAPSSIDLSAAELQLFQTETREQTLKELISPHKKRFDYIMIDCPPSLGFLTLNALAASDGLIVPLQCAYWAMRGMKQLMDTLERVKASGINPDIELTGVLLTMYNSRTIHSNQVLERAREAFGDKVFKTIIKETVRFDYATVAGESVLTHAKSSEAADWYRSVAKEVDSVQG